MLRLAFDFIITWRETRTRPNAYACYTFFVMIPKGKTSHLRMHGNGLPCTWFRKTTGRI